ncbi:MAG TPA: hypothetical protein VLA99_00185 [Nitrospiraceae bacterium]|nr:hypothetical protein [Nitrospiraceae bacterium]
MAQALIPQRQRALFLSLLFVTAMLWAAIAMAVWSEGWLDQLTGFILVQQGTAQAKAEPGTFDPYIGQVALVRSLYDRNEMDGSYLAMNRLMDMLENREGGISAGAADAIGDYCYQVTPPALHDVKRHKQWWDKTVEWDKFFWEE